MKKTLFLFLILINYVAFAQETISDESTNFLARIKSNYTALYDSPTLTANRLIYLNEGDFVPGFQIFDENSSLKRKYLGVYKDTLLGYVLLNDVFMNTENLEYLQSNKGDAEIRREKAKRSALYLLLDKLDKIKNKFEDYDKVGLVITKKEYAFQEYSDAFGLELEFYNGYSKTIKYIDVTVRPYNRVGDLTKDDFGRDVQRVQVIGPLNAKKISEVTFNNMFWDENDTIEYLVISYMKITFMDNSVKEIKNLTQHLGEGVFNGK